MDLRIERTRRSIINAFIELRSAKNIEKITVKELAEKACINKATFYQHYHDIYDLSGQLEDELIRNVINSIPDPELIITDTPKGFAEYSSAILSQSGLFHILFAGSRRTVLLEKLDYEIKKLIHEKMPKYKDSLEFDLLFTVLIHGTFDAFLTHTDKDVAQVIDILGNISNCMVSGYRNLI